MQPLSWRVVWLRGKEPLFRLERLDFESVCCGCLVSFRFISPSHSHLSGSRPHPLPTPQLVMLRARKAQRWWEGAREAWRSYSHRLLWILFLRGAVGAVKAIQLESEAFGGGGAHSPLLGTARAWFWSSSNLPSQSIRAPCPEKLRLHRFFTI